MFSVFLVPYSERFYHLTTTVLYYVYKGYSSILVNVCDPNYCVCIINFFACLFLSFYSSGDWKILEKNYSQSVTEHIWIFIIYCKWLFILYSIFALAVPYLM